MVTTRTATTTTTTSAEAVDRVFVVRHLVRPVLLRKLAASRMSIAHLSARVGMVRWQKAADHRIQLSAWEDTELQPYGSAPGARERDRSSAVDRARRGRPRPRARCLVLARCQRSLQSRPDDARAPRTIDSGVPACDPGSAILEDLLDEARGHLPIEHLQGNGGAHQADDGIESVERR